MAIEQGIIVSTGPQGSNTAWVKTVRSSACASCSSRDSCNPGGEGNAQVVEAINAADAKVGDRIQLVIKTGAMLKAMSLLYLFPILCMIGGGMLGERMALTWQINASASAAGVAFGCLALSFIIIRFVGQRMGKKEAYRPKVVRILGHNPSMVNASDPPMGCETSTSR